MDTLYDHVCESRMNLLDRSLINLLRRLEDTSRFASQSINKKNKIDFNKIIILLTNSITDHKEQIKHIVEKYDNWLSGNTMVEVKEGKYALQLIRYFLIPLTSERKCKDDLQMLNEKAKVITAGAVQALLMNIHF
eukprot:GFUD01068498.1.p1 GENE.GFUD01068498.1~~GFUD01068498.1.p1  ORF type:complete len:146 (+),score=18.22 GFUD01068498.1:34-438(+)